MFDQLLRLAAIVAGFGIVSLAADDIGRWFRRINLPLISGFLACGILVGPYALGLIESDAIEYLGFIDEVSIAFIAFAAGAELYLKELRDRMRSIAWTTAGQLVFTYSFGVIAVVMLADSLPLISELDGWGRLAAGMLAGSILVARSPSSAIAIVKELRARGPFTRTVLGVTVIMDVAVILVFAISSSAADALLTGVGASPTAILLLLVEIAASIGLGWLVAQVLRGILVMHGSPGFKSALVLATGYLVFLGSTFVREHSHDWIGAEVLLEPLLICMIAGLVVTNATPHRAGFLSLIQHAAPAVFVAFFTLTGASLELDVLAVTWKAALVLFGVRMAGIFLGSLVGGTLAGDPPLHNRVGWMTYLTQAGVGLGLAKEIAVEFPTWGPGFATLIIAVIVVDQLVGPPFFKYAIRRVGEAHDRAETPEFDGVRDAILFGNEGQALALARQLAGHGWNVKLAAPGESALEVPPDSGIELVPVGEVTLDTLAELDAGQAEAIVTLLDDAANFRICELAYEHYGTDNLVARINQPDQIDRFHELGVLVVDPRTAMVHLMDHFVRSPRATSLLLGMEADRDVIEIQLTNPNLFGAELRELRLPEDTLVLSIRRGGDTLITHGYTRLQHHDWLTVMGTTESLDEVMLRLEG